MVPVVFGTARLVVTMLLWLVPSWRSLLPSANQRGKAERFTGWAAQGPCTQRLEGEFIKLFIYSFNISNEHLPCARLRDGDVAESKTDS